MTMKTIAAQSVEVDDEITMGLWFSSNIIRRKNLKSVHSMQMRTSPGESHYSFNINTSFQWVLFMDHYSLVYRNSMANVVEASGYLAVSSPWL